VAAAAAAQVCACALDLLPELLFAEGCGPRVLLKEVHKRDLL
jgi:hypothetical protein